jgi:PAB-dependent poly(A)-specific ribonuclease subunit 2
MPHYSDPLLSAIWPAKYVIPVGIAPVTVDPEIIAQVKMIDFVGYAPNLFYGKRHRNQVPPEQAASAGKRNTTFRPNEPKFRSEKERDAMFRKFRSDSGAAGVDNQALSTLGMPDYYRKVEIKYSRFGVEDFDFAFYNQTRFGGLETHIANSYANALLQLMFFTEPLRAIMKHHMVGSCKKEFCLSCELGFLMRMLEDANGLNCHASNFLRAFATIPQGNLDFQSIKTMTVFAIRLRTIILYAKNASTQT